jgi:hypothetical protein
MKEEGGRTTGNNQGILGRIPPFGTLVRPLGLWLLVLAGATGCSPGDNLTTISAGTLEMVVTRSGEIGSFSDMASGREYLPEGVSAPLLTLRVGGADLLPVAASLDGAGQEMVLDFPGGLTARVGVEVHPSHASFELLGLSTGAPTTGAPVELVIWGPYPTTIHEIIGETVGVVRGESFAMGLQALNPRTLGGYPWNENDAMPQLDIFESGDYSDLSEEGKRYVLYRVEAAKPDSFGSTLQAYTRNRSEERVIPNWGHERYTAGPYLDGGVVGSRIALFGCPVEDALATLGVIEVAEGLPHPMIDGEWGKEASSASAAYVILPFSETTIQEAVEVTLQAGLRYLYHPEPFESWGHFRLGPDFPSGVEGLKEVVDQAEAQGVRVGLHTLSNFITTDDPYVTPVPDPRLARVGTSVLTQGVGVSDDRIGIKEPGFFNQFENNHLRGAVVGQEIIRYGSVSQTAPWTLLDVERGAFGTQAQTHGAGEPIGKLADHGYRVFLADAELGREMAENLAHLFNETGLRQISFDGLEGNRSTGMGNYGEILFTMAWFDALSPDIRDHFIADASRTSHFFWHLYSRMNWGEPWYAGFRESQTEYRLKNQAYFQRNMMPGMLGWFRMQGETSVEDIEWMLARSAAFDAGYAFVTSFESLEENGRTPEILHLMGTWEEARMLDVFSHEQKARMKDISNEFHLEEEGDSGWSLHQIHSQVVRLENRERQPGEPSHLSFGFSNPGSPQPLRFLLSAQDSHVDQVVLEVDGVARMDLVLPLQAGETLVYAGDGVATLYSASWKVIRSVAVDDRDWVVGPGEHTLVLDGSFSEQDEGVLRMELRLWADPETIRR